jgi:hypothetical protein
MAVMGFDPSSGVGVSVYRMRTGSFLFNPILANIASTTQQEGVARIREAITVIFCTRILLIEFLPYRLIGRRRVLVGLNWIDFSENFFINYIAHVKKIIMHRFEGCVAVLRRERNSVGWTFDGWWIKAGG